IWDCLPKEVQERARIVSLAVGRVARGIPEVHSFRREVLCGALLSSADQIDALLRSPAACALAPADFARLRVPVVGHWAEIIEAERTESYTPGAVCGSGEVRATLRLGALGVTDPVEYQFQHSWRYDGVSSVRQAGVPCGTVSGTTVVVP